MHTLIKSVGLASTVASLGVSLSASADVSATDTNTATFNFSGNIEAMCKVKGNNSATASVMVIDQNNTSQDIGTLEVWCNTGRNATTKYTSANNGFLVDGNNKIAYTLNVGNSAGDIDLSTVYTDADTDAGNDDKGSAKSHTLKVTPQSSGLDFAGQYSDTITVTVTYN